MTELLTEAFASTPGAGTPVELAWYGCDLRTGGIIEDLILTRKSERENRIIDHGSDSSMEQKKKEGYF